MRGRATFTTVPSSWTMPLPRTVASNTCRPRLDFSSGAGGAASSDTSGAAASSGTGPPPVGSIAVLRGPASVLGRLDVRVQVEDVVRVVLRLDGLQSLV